MKLYNIKFSGYFGSITIDELETKSMIQEIVEQFKAEAINYSNFNKIGTYSGYRTHLIVDALYTKNCD